MSRLICEGFVGRGVFVLRVFRARDRGPGGANDVDPHAGSGRAGPGPVCLIVGEFDDDFLSAAALLAGCWQRESGGGGEEARNQQQHDAQARGQSAVDRYGHEFLQLYYQPVSAEIT